MLYLCFLFATQMSISMWLCMPPSKNGPEVVSDSAPEHPTVRYTVRDRQHPLQFDRSTLHLERLLCALDKIVWRAIGTKQTPRNDKDNEHRLHAKVLEEGDRIVILFPGTNFSLLENVALDIRLEQEPLKCRDDTGQDPDA